MLADEGARALTASIAHHCYLSQLSIGGNDIHSDGVLAVATSIKCGNLCVKRLYLENNQVEVDGIKAIYEMLCSNHCSQLKLLSMKNCFTKSTCTIDLSFSNVKENQNSLCMHPSLLE